MLRKAALLLLPVLLLAAACGGDANKSTTKTATPKPTTNTTAGKTAEKTVASPTPGQDAASALFDTVNPFQLLGGLSGAPSSGDVDPTLKSVLLGVGDLPGGFMSMGDFTYNMPSEYGTAQLAANIFASGDLTSGQFGAMVMSAAMALPPDALSQFDELGGLQQLQDLSDADLAQLQSAAEGFGVTFSDLSLLDGSGLGDGGVGMHMVMDFGGLMEAFGASSADNPFANGLALDMYMFLRGDHMLLVMVMWPAGGAAGVDSRGLADALDSNASGTF